MGTRTMGSHGDYGGVGSNVGGGTQVPKSDLLAREGSLYNLTLDEVQNQLGDLWKPLSSMNFDELLKSVWSAEANQGLGRQDYGAAQQGEVASTSSLHGQSRLLSGDLSNKTVDEVWRDIEKGQNKARLGRKPRERKSTLGEMTLEAFLVKVGIVSEGEKGSGPVLEADPITLPQENVPHQAHWTPYHIPSIHQPPQQQQQNMLAIFIPGNPIQQALPNSTNPVMDAYPETQMTLSTSPLMGTLSDTQTPVGRKRTASTDVVEKTVERRQKRMIKNRESAARSRARKQAYTHELENKILRLEEENERLKRQKEVENVLSSVIPPEPKYQLRRTSSATF